MSENKKRFPTLIVLPIVAVVGFVAFSTLTRSGSKATSGYVADADLRAVCQGVASNASPVYSKTAGVIHPIKMFVGKAPQYDIYGPQLPSSWETVRNVELVGCADRVEDKLVKTCEGYEKDNKPTGNKIEMFDAVYTLRIVEAKTAKPVGDPVRIESKGGDCSMLESFDGTNVTKQTYAINGPAMVAALKAYVQP
jgi:hypothetical protein